MDLENLLSDKRSRAIKNWRESIYGTYPEDSRGFFRKEKDQFSNPVGNVIFREIEKLYDEICTGSDFNRISSCLDNIIRIRAVQDFKPSQAVAFVLHLKTILREILGEEISRRGLSSEFQGLEMRIDKIALLAFDIYSNCRQKIYDVRVKEVKNQLGRLLERANLTFEIPQHNKDL